MELAQFTLVSSSSPEVTISPVIVSTANNMLATRWQIVRVSGSLVPPGLVQYLHGWLASFLNAQLIQCIRFFYKFLKFLFYNQKRPPWAGWIISNRQCAHTCDREVRDHISGIRLYFTDHLACLYATLLAS